jgi:DNA ligase D-like protein (predicted 3'-phosphoesterase)
MHYDFRLEIDGVLKSWAVPKGLSTDPKDKRLAVQTEDHPMEYADFEGTIPEGEYGAGAVIVWDRGTYSTANDGEPVSMAEAIDKGRATIWLDGQKLKGAYALVRTGKPGDTNWLIIKKKDEHANRRHNPVNTQPQSVLTGRTVKQVGREKS